MSDVSIEISTNAIIFLIFVEIIEQFRSNAFKWICERFVLHLMRNCRQNKRITTAIWKRNIWNWFGLFFKSIKTENLVSKHISNIFADDILLTQSFICFDAKKLYTLNVFFSLFSVLNFPKHTEIRWIKWELKEHQMNKRWIVTIEEAHSMVG